MLYICSVKKERRSNNSFLYNFGGLAHLARALEWHSKGDRFESGILHLSASS